VADPIRGKTIRWRYSDGPTVGMEFEHVFSPDGAVTFRRVDKDGASMPSEKTKYEVARVNDDVYAVTYLAPSGWTLTTALDMKAGTMVSIASNEKELFVQRGTFDRV